jgi:hypothetical protein
MKFIYILSGTMKLVDLLLIDSDRFNLLKEVSLTDISKKAEILVEIKISVFLVEKKLRELLEYRRTHPLDIPSNADKFDKDEVFVNRTIFNETLLLCTTGFDNLIIFLSNIYDNLKTEPVSHYLLYVKNHKEYREWRNGLV